MSKTREQYEQLALEKILESKNTNQYNEKDVLLKEAQVYAILATKQEVVTEKVYLNSWGEEL